MPIEESPQPQRTWLAILVLMLIPIPVVGLIVAIAVQRSTPSDTNANTCAMIATVLAGMCTAVGCLAAAVYGLMLMAFATGRGGVFDA